MDGNKVFLLANQHIKMISEGSCDTENWNNDAKIHHRSKKKHIYMPIENTWIFNTIFHNITVYITIYIFIYTFEQKNLGGWKIVRSTG